MKIRAVFLLVFSTFWLTGYCASENLKLNQIQVFMSHNSYRMRTYQPLFEKLSSMRHPMCKAFLSRPWDYTHNTPLDSQLSVYGLRGLELDIYHDPNGGLFYERRGNKIIDQKTESGINDLKKPGLKVMHIPDFDYMTHHYTFIDALRKIKKWSDENKNHLPVFIMVEAKEFHVMKYLKRRFCADVLPFTKNAVDSIDLEIETVFGKNSKQILCPDDVRKEFTTLNDAILKNGWPALSEARGKIVFVFSASDKAKNAYLKDHYSLKDRYMFTYSSPGKPEAAIIKIENPEKHFKEIQRLVKLGYFVRTRADANTKEARKNADSRQQHALASGAQLIGTDYYIPDYRAGRSKKWSAYKTGFPEGSIARLNPLNTIPSDTIYLSK